MPSLNQACKQLKIGRIKLFGYLEKLQIEPAVVGNAKQISIDHVERVRLAIEEDSTPLEIKAEQSQTRLTNKAEQSQVHSSNETKQISQSNPRLFEQMSNEIAHLKQLLAEEKEERREERAERTNYQAMLGALQQNNQKLQQDNQRLQLELLEAPKTEMKFESNLEQVAQVEETEKDELPSPIVANSKFGTSWGIGLSVVGIVAVLFFTAITTGQGAQWLPLMQEKIAAALKNNVPNAGNH
jgi:flagellar biosynthesis GTPase FlhF